MTVLMFRHEHRACGIEAPAPDGAIWPHCGHPKSEQNTQHIGAAGDRCRICRRKINRESMRRAREQQKEGLR